MAKILTNLEVPLDYSLDDFIKKNHPEVVQYRILRQSVDARRRHKLHIVYTIEVAYAGENLGLTEFNLERVKSKPALEDETPIIVGSGPAGLFAALRFVERGLPCRLFEQGSEAEIRIKKINQFWRNGVMDEADNVCFGEGGAGLYSDGKLMTRIKSPYIPYVMDRLVQFGAPPEIRFLANPHVGSDRIRRVIPIMRKYLLENGCKIFFNSKVKEIQFQNNQTTGLILENGIRHQGNKIILATGHSAEEILNHVIDQGVATEEKSFAIGVRIEHPQKEINKIQYRGSADHPRLKELNYQSAAYKLTYHEEETQTGVFSFCMCPGGYVLSSGTEKNRVVSNGMSNYRRNSDFANSAIVVTIDHQKFYKQKSLKNGLLLRKQIEGRAFEAIRETGKGSELPAQSLNDFLSGKLGIIRKGSCPSGETAARVDEMLPKWIRENLVKGLLDFDKNMSGFISSEAQVYGVETRTSCPIRIVRDDQSFESISHKGLYPCGEGAGYAGGITSAACDGIRVAEAILSKY